MLKFFSKTKIQSERETRNINKGVTIEEIIDFSIINFFHLFFTGKEETSLSFASYSRSTNEHMFDMRDELLKDVEDEPESKHGAVGIGDK